MTYSIAEARDRLQELIDRALRGETVLIMRDGLPAVELKPAPGQTECPRMSRSEIDRLRTRRAGRKLKEGAVAAVSRVRNEE